jgi:hypothetical protein
MASFVFAATVPGLRSSTCTSATPAAILGATCTDTIHGASISHRATES